MQDTAQTITPVNSYVDAYEPPTSTPTPQVTAQEKNSESLEDQNIFELLGVSDGTDAEKEAFLLELQRVLWDDFLQYDVQLLITKDEYAELQKQRDASQDEAAKEEAVVAYLEKLIPDLEEIMLEKALELKGDMVRERITGLRELYVSEPDKIAVLDTADSQVKAGTWRSAATTLNTLHV